jgi:hypothetical protein
MGRSAHLVSTECGEAPIKLDNTELSVLARICFSAAVNGRFAAATPHRRGAHLGCRDAVGGSSRPRLLRHPKKEESPWGRSCDSQAAP